MKKNGILLGAILAVALPATVARAAIGEWSAAGDKARVRLLSSGLDAAGRLVAGIEIELAPGWKTYWRTPGDAGIPPVIDFTASQNVGKVDVAFPPPMRHDDGYSVTNTYEGTVVLPLAVAMPHPKSAADLSLKLDIGVCSDVCVPEHFEVSLPVPAAAADADADAVLAPALKAVPGAPQPGVFAVDSIASEGGTGKHAKFVMTASVPDPDKAEVFIEGASDWYPDVPEYAPGAAGKATYRFAFDTLGSKTPLDGGKVRVTIVSGDRAIEQWVALP